MVVSEGAINNIMGGMENTAGVRLHSHRHKLKQRFDIIRKLGQGTYGKVQLAVNKETGQEVAIKTIKKAKIETEQDLIRIRREIQIMSSVQHPQIIHIYEVFENREKMVLVMEYAAGGELYDYLSERKVLPEHDARRIFRQVSSAVYYCHKHKICHRDLKLENILLDIEGNAKIADFGLSNVFDDKHKLDTFCGSPLYASPEIVKGIKYTGPEVDCWSLGVLLYTLVYGAMPFDGSNFRRLVKQITQGDFYEPSSPSSASELIRHMLTVSATDRATIEIICNHWWVNEGYSESCLKIAEALANQTPVRLDLLLSLAPKHINSEHMLIQPEEEDPSHRNEAGRAPPQLQLPPPPPTDQAGSAQSSAVRSHSLGAVNALGTLEIEQLIEKKRKERQDVEKKRHAEEAPTKEKKKKRESDSMSVTPRQSRKSLASADEDKSEKKPPTRPPEGEGAVEKKLSVKKKEGSSERSERKKSVKKRDSAVDMDISEGTERKKSVKKREDSIEKDVSEGDKSTRKKTVKKRDSSTNREPSEEKGEKRRSVKKKESSREKSTSKTSVPSGSEAMSVISDKPNTNIRQCDESVSSDVKPVNLNIPESCDNNQSKLSKMEENRIPEPSKLHVDDAKTHRLSASGRSLASGGSGDGTLIASDSSVSRESGSPSQLQAEPQTVPGSKPVETLAPSVNKSDSASKVKKNESLSKVSKTTSSSKVSKTGSPAKVSKNTSNSSISDHKNDVTLNKVDTSPRVSKTSSTKKISKSLGSREELRESTKYNGNDPDLLQIDTEKILQETAEKIKRAEEAMAAQQEEQEQAMTNREVIEGGGGSASSKDSSQPTSVMSTPARSRTGSESSTESRSSRPDGSRRQSKIFSKAALWDNMISQNQEKPAPPEKPKKVNRVGGLNMTDLAKKFEDKSSGDRKSVVLPSVKVSDARRAFEAKPSDKPTSPRRKSSLSGGSDSSLSKESSKDGINKSGTISPPSSKPVKLSSSSSGTNDVKTNATDTPLKKEISSKEKQDIKEVVKEKSPVKEAVKSNKSSISNKAKSPSKSPVREQKNIAAKTAVKEPHSEKKIDSKLPPEKKLTVDEKVKSVNDKEKMPLANSEPVKIPITVQESKITKPGSNEEDSVIVGGLNLKLGDVGKITEVGTSHSVVVPAETSDSSDSESEAERVLRLLSEKREKLEAAKREKMRKVSEAKEREAVRHDMPAIREEPQEQHSKSPSKSPDKCRSNASESPDQKFATLPRGFKTKYPVKKPVASKSSREEPNILDKDRARTVTNGVSQEENEIRELRDSLSRTLSETPPPRALSRESTPLKKEVQAIPPSQVLAPTPRDSVLNSTEPSYRRLVDNTRAQNQFDPGRKKTQMEIVLENRSVSDNKNQQPNKQSYAEIQLRPSTPSSAKDVPRTQEYKTEVCHTVSSPRNSISGEPQLQRARRERIIPIMMEDAEDHDDLSLSEGHSSSSAPYTPSTTTRSYEPLSTAAMSSAAMDHKQSVSTASPEPIRKSRRERIIPISVEGEGVVTPPPQSEGAGASFSHSQVMVGEEDLASPSTALTQRRSQHPLPRSWSKRLHHNNSRGRGFLLDHSESFSSAGEDEEDEEDGFQILTAESLFSTLLNRVRSLTRKMNDDQPGMRLSGGSRRTSQQPTPEPQHTSPGPGSSGFWSQLYSSPRDSPSRRISEPLSPLSRSSVSREVSKDEDTTNGLGSPFWSRSMSRDPSDVDAIFSEPNTPFSTLPRGWRSRWSGEEIGGESDNSEASSNRSSRKVPYSRGPSRDLHKIPDVENESQDGRTAWTSSTLPHASRQKYAAEGGSLFSKDNTPERYRPDYYSSKSVYDPTSNIRKSQERRGLQRYSQDRETTPKYSQDFSITGRKLSQDREIPIRVVPDSEKYGHDRRFRVSQDREPGAGSYIQHPRTQLDRDNFYNSPNTKFVARPQESDRSLTSTSKNLQSTVNKAPAGEAIGRDGGHYKQQSIKTTEQSSPDVNNKEKDISIKDKETESSTSSSNKHSVHNQLEQLVKELENVPDEELQKSLQNHAHADTSNKSLTDKNNPALKELSTSENEQRQPVLSVGKNNSNNELNESDKTKTSLVLRNKSQLDKDVLNSKHNSAGITPKTFSFQKRMETVPTVLPQKAVIPVKPQLPNIKSDLSKLSDNNIVQNLPQGNTVLQTPSFSNKEQKNDITTIGNKQSSTDISKLAKSSSKVQEDGLKSSENSNQNLAKKSEATQENKSVSKQDINKMPTHTLNPYMRSKTTLLPDTKKNTIISSNSAKSLSSEQYKRGKTEDLKATVDLLKKRDTPIDKYRRAADPSNSSIVKTDPIIKTYCRSKSRELTPAIEAAGEKFTQLNSGTLKKISPFEAYRKSKSRELAPVLDLLNRNQGIPDGQTRSAAIATAERAKSPFEKAKTSIEKKLVRAKSPLGRQKTPEPKKSIDEYGCLPITKDELTDSPDGAMVATPTGCIEPGAISSMNCMKPNTSENNENLKVKDKDSDKNKKTSIDGEKPKSMYQLIASKFNRSQSNVPDDTKSQTSIAQSEDETSEKDDKFKLKRPSRFLKNKSEKGSRLNLSESDVSKHDESEKHDRKPSKKLSDALNKFLGRRPEETTNRSAKSDTHITDNNMTNSTSENENSERDSPTKPPRFRSKKLSNSQDSLAKVNSSNSAITDQSNEKDNEDITLESVTKSICDHLTQLENDINSSSASKSKANSTYSNKLSKLPVTDSSGCLSKNAAVDQLEDENSTATESTTSGVDDLRGHASEAEDESVMDRITRKSYYSRFQDVKKKPKLRRQNTKESIDQQLAAAKARLQQEDFEKAHLARDTLSPLRYTAQRSSLTTSPPPFIDGVVRRGSRKSSVPRTASLPPEDGLALYMGGGGYRGTSVQPDVAQKLRYASLSPEKSFHSPIFHSEKENISDRQERVQEAFAAAVAAGAAAGEAAANIMKGRSETKDRSMARDLSVIHDENAEGGTVQESNNEFELSNRAGSVTPQHSTTTSPTPQYSSKDEAISSAREELTRRLTPLTRLSNMTNKDSGIKNYRRTYTAGRLGDTTSFLDKTSPAPLVERPAYRRTNTMDLPPSDARVRPGSEYRRFLQEPSRRYSTTR